MMVQMSPRSQAKLALEKGMTRRFLWRMRAESSQETPEESLSVWRQDLATWRPTAPVTSLVLPSCQDPSLWSRADTNKKTVTQEHFPTKLCLFTFYIHFSKDPAATHAHPDPPPPPLEAPTSPIPSLPWSPFLQQQPGSPTS